MRPLRYGILGTGGIAATLANAIAASGQGVVGAAASRSLDKAETFAATHSIPRAYGSYVEVLTDADIDVVYIALPNNLHCEWTCRAAAAGKHILCEKPLAMDVAEAECMVDAVRQHDVFLMEAFMYRCHPQTAKIVKLIRDGALGEVRSIDCSFTHPGAMNHPNNIRCQAALGGGAIMDVGGYVLSMARLVAGAALGRDFADPLELIGHGHIGDMGVDEWACATVRFDRDILATLTCSMRGALEDAAIVYGTTGNLHIDVPWWPGEGESIMTIRRGGEREPIRVACDLSSHACQMGVVARHLADRQATCPAMNWADSLGNMRWLDRWREQAHTVAR